MSNHSPQAKRRLDYQPPSHLIKTTELSINLQDDKVKVKSQLHVFSNNQENLPLTLDGEGLTLVQVKLNGKALQEYQLTDSQLILSDIPDECFIEIFTEVDAKNNSSLEGLYFASDSYCTQCEAEGFRKITYYLDRPDVLSEYTVTIYADKKRFPYLLSNGNPVAKGDLDDGVHWVKWHDPFKKPCYLFALVAGDFDLLKDQFTTRSGKKVALELFVDKGKKHRGQHALDSLKRAMRWDEEEFGLEYDLDIYMIVAVDFFNMGAMENKGLNVFNSKFVLADSESATDDDYFNIESVIAHEYFHNWTGNRVTCRDWFQLSLKEGLTVFRDQQFSADMTSHVVNRIKSVKVIREHQFAEDASAMSHPIRPDEVIEMNNFYTVTVYDKGAEVIRMLHTILGKQGFRNGLDLYFKRHDGQAVTCDDFVNAMADANSADLKQFKNWYSQSGTPIIEVQDEYDQQNNRLTLQLKQINRPTADQAEKRNLHIPIGVELISLQQQEKPIQQLMNLHEASQSVVLEQVNGKPDLALLTNFSAPVKLRYHYDAKALVNIALGGQDGFCRWDAAQQLYSHYIHGLTPNAQRENAIDVTLQNIFDLILGLFKQTDFEPDLLAEMLALPSHETLVQQVDKYFVDELIDARKQLINQIAEQFSVNFSDQYTTLTGDSYRYTKQQINQRKLKNLCLLYLAFTSEGEQKVKQQFQKSDNMTDTLGALKAAQQAKLSCFESLMTEFEQTWADDALVLDKWFALHAGSESDDVLSRLELLMGHKQFTLNNPNRVRSVVGTFAFYNPRHFHRGDGAGYRFLTDYLLKLDKINPQIAARLVTPLTQWQNMEQQRSSMMCRELARLLDSASLSKDVYEKVSKSLSLMKG